MGQSMPTLRSGRRSEPQAADVAEEGAALADQQGLQGHLVASTTAAARRTQGDTAPRRRGANRGRDDNSVGTRSSSPEALTPPTLPVPRRLRNRSRSRSPLSPQGEPQGPDSRLVAAYYSEAVACSTCQKANPTPATSPIVLTPGNAARPELYTQPSDSDYSSAGSAATTPPSKDIVYPPSRGSSEGLSIEVQSLLKSLQSTEGAADGGEPSPPPKKKLPRVESILTGVVVEVESLSQSGPTSTEGTIDVMESLHDNEPEPQSPERAPAPGPVSLASSVASSVRHARVMSLAPTETEPSPLVTSPPQQDGTPLSSLSEQSPGRLTSESGDARQSDSKDSEEDIDVGIMIAPSAFDGFFFGIRDDDKDKTDYFEQVRLRTLQSFDATHTPGDGSQDGEQLAVDEVIVEAIAEEAIAEEAIPEDAFTEDAFAAVAIAKEAISEEAISKEAIAKEAISKEAMSKEAKSEEATTEEVIAQKAIAEKALAEETIEEVPDQDREDSGPVGSSKCAQGHPSSPIPTQSNLAQREAPDESNYEFDVSSGQTEISDEYSVDVEVLSRQTKVSDALELRDQMNEDATPRLNEDASDNMVHCSNVELMEIARTSMALTAASSSVPDSESVPLIDHEAVGEEDEETDTAEGAGDDSLVGCDMDLKHVAAGLFDPTPRPPQAPPPPPPNMALTKGGSLPAATSAADEQVVKEARPQARSDRKLGSFGVFPFRAKRRQDKAQRSATASALIPCPAPARATATPSEDKDAPPATTSATSSTTRRLSIDLKVADVKQTPGAPPTSTSTHRILSDVLQGIRQVILPRKSSRRGIAKRSGHRLLPRREAPVEAPAEAPAAEEQQAAMSEQAVVAEQAAEAEQTSDTAAAALIPPEDDEEAVATTATDASTPRSASQSEQPSRTSSEGKSGPGGVKKNHVEPSPVTDLHTKLRNPASTRGNISRSNCEEISETHSRSSRSSIAPPRTNFLTDSVLKSLARSSSIKYIDSTLRSTQRISGKTPERYRNVPLPIPKPESSKTSTPTASKCSSPRSRGSRKGLKLRKRIKISETAICNDNSNALNCLTDHKENNKYYVYTVNDDKATELRLSEMFVLQEEPAFTVEELPPIQDTAKPERSTGKAKKGAGKKDKQREGKAGKAPASKLKQGAPSSTTSKILRKKSLTRPASLLLRPRRSGEKLRGSKKGARTPKVDKKASSALSIKKRQTEVLKRLRQFSPSDGVVEIVSSAIKKCESVEQRDNAPQLPGRVRDSCTGSSAVSAAVSAAVSRGQSQPHSLASSSMQSRESCGPSPGRGSGARRTSTRRGAPRYRPTLRTPRISCVGMGAGNEVALVQRDALEAGAVGRARIPFKHPAHGVKVPQAAIAHREQLAAKAVTVSATPVKGRTPAFSGLHEMTEMLFEYSTLAAARGRSYANVHSELVSLFEAPTKASLPSNESHGVISESTNPSADQVLVGLHRVEVASSSRASSSATPRQQVSSSAGDAEEVRSTLLSPKLSSKQLAEHTEMMSSATSSKQRSDNSQRSGFKICSVDTEAKVAAALQEIMNSLTDLRCTDTDGALSSEHRDPPPGTQAIPEEKLGDRTAVVRTRNDHLHGLRYRPSKGLSTFDILDTIFIEESNSKLQSKQRINSAKKPGHSVKIDTWTSDVAQVTSNSVQATVSTASAVCQRTRISSPEDASVEALPKPNLPQTNRTLEDNCSLFEKRNTPVQIAEKKISNQSQEPLTTCAEECSYQNDFGIDTIDMSPEYIPRLHNDMVQNESAVRSRHSPILLSSTSFTKTKCKNVTLTSPNPPAQHASATDISQAKLTGPQRAQKRIACLMGDDIPGTVLAVLTEVLPIFLKRTRSELETPRQSQIQRLLYEEYFNHPANASDGQNAREDPQARQLVGTMAYQVALLVEDTARSAEMEVKVDGRPP